VICDCDNGFGSAINVVHLVRRYEAAGIAAVCLEDKEFPKTNSFVPRPQKLVSVETFTAKIRAATMSRENPDLAIIARVEALIAGLGAEEALRRAEAYANAGADAILFHSKEERPDEILSLLRLWGRRCPTFVVPTSYPSVTATELAEAGADGVIYANHAIRATIQVLGEILPEIVRERGTRTIEQRIAPLERVFRLQGIEELMRVERMLPSGCARGIVAAPGHVWPAEISRAAVEDGCAAEFFAQQIALLDQAGVKDLTVVGVPAAGVLAPPGVRIFAPAGGGLLPNLRTCMLESRDVPEAVLVVSEDVLVSPSAIRNLLESNAPIATLVDPGGDDERGETYLVECDAPARSEGHRLNANPRHRLVSIEWGARSRGRRLEYVGVSLFKPDGVALFLDAYERYAHRYKERPFGRAARFEDASFVDFLQVYAADGGGVTAVEQYKGWLPLRDWHPGPAGERAGPEQVGR
jgi:phosphoenolpyruvate phosphomutase